MPARLTAFAIGLALLASASAVPAEPRTDLTVAAPWEIAGADPAKEVALQRLGIMETLVDAETDGTLIPGLATAWEASDDGLRWTFALREAAFHDGTELTAEAAVAALARAVEQPGPLGTAPIGEISAAENAVVITLDTPFAALPALLAHYSTVIPAPAAFDAEGRPVEAIGTGPFRVTALEPPQKIEAVRFEDYWGTPAVLERITYMAAKRAETRALLAETGDADMVFTLDPAGFERLQREEGVEAVSLAIPRVMLLKVNAGHPSLASPEARRALSLAIDRDGIAAGIIRFPEAAANQVFPPALGKWHDPSLAPVTYNPDAAAELLAAEGWEMGEDGVLVRDGARFELTLRTFPDRPELPLVAAALQDQWRAIGVALEVSVANYSEIPAGHQDGSLDVALFARNYGLTPDPIGTVVSDYSSGGGDWGAMNWDAPRVAEAVAEIAATADDATRAPLIAEVAAALQADLPMIPVVWYQHTVAVADGLENVVIDPLERDYGLDRVRWAAE